MNRNTSPSSVSRFLGFLFIVMFIAKVFGFTDLSWWVVTFPFWLGPAIALVVVVIYKATQVLARFFERVHKSVQKDPPA